MGAQPGSGVARCGPNAYTPPMPNEASAPVAAVSDCPRCLKPLPLCICDAVEPIDTKVALLIVQHPQEQDRALGTARLTALHFRNATLKIGLSWPSLTKALGRPVDPQRWAVLYLGSAHAAQLAPGRDVVVLDRKGAALADQEAALAGIEGVVVLDGTWSQAKTLWWRNAWMLKCRRIVLGPERPSRYGKLRRGAAAEPPREAPGDRARAQQELRPNAGALPRGATRESANRPLSAASATAVRAAA